MKRNLFKTIIIVFILFSIINVKDDVWADKSPKIGVINLQIALNTCEPGKRAMEKLKKEQEAKYSTIMMKEKNIKALSDRINSTTPTLMNEIERKGLGETYYKKVKELERLKEDFNAELAKNERELSAKILDGIVSTARKIGQEDGYTLIMAKGQNIIFSVDQVDITQKTIKRFNEEQKTE